MAQAKRIVLVGTYKGGQLARWRGWYNYPVSDADKITGADAAKVTELWLFNGAKAGRFYRAEFVGFFTRKELVRDYGYPATSKPHGTRYALYKTSETEIYNPASGLAEAVIVRASDFAKRSPKIAKQIKAYLESPERNDPVAAKLVPEILAGIPRETLHVCEAAVQYDFLPLLFPLKIGRCDVAESARRKNMSVIDLFAGCGGMSLGFEFAGFSPVLAVEKDAWAAETYAFNRHGVKVVTADITKIAHPRRAFPDVGDVFGVIGGPPCQGFSLSGGRDPKDPRNSLFMDYMRFVSEYRPSFFVMENVPGILSSLTKQGERVKDVIVSIAEEIGYNVRVLQLNAADYGVPQSRQRVFFVGLRTDVPFMPEWLVPQKTTEHNPVTIRQALSDLPVISAGGGQESMSYQTDAVNPYQEWCRRNSTCVRNHIAMRHTRRLVERFHVIRWGESAADVPKEHMQRKRGDASVISGKIYSQNNMRPFPDRPSPTVPASFQSNFVHPLYDRNYTAREGARLQSFPDNYVFCGRRTTMSWEKNLSQYQQIGNAVPPLLAKALGEMIVRYFSRIDKMSEKGDMK